MFFVETATRRQLSERQSLTVKELLDAAERLLVDHDYEDLTLRMVAAEAGVTHTTAYSYFSSKAHLVAETFRRRLASIPHPDPVPAAPLPKRVEAALAGPGLALRDEPALAAAILPALLGNDADVSLLRDSIGADLAARLATALGDDVSPQVAESLLLVFSGSMLQAGMGYFDYDGVVDRVLRTAELLGN